MREFSIPFRFDLRPIIVGARQLVRQDGGAGSPFYGAQPLQPTQTRAPTDERLPFFAA